MNAHESIRALLALAAAGALRADEQQEVERHAQVCESCRRELELWGSYAQGLRRLPQPEFPPDLLARTQARILRDHAHAMDRHRNGLMYCVLAAYSWVMSFAVWIAVRALTGGTLEILGTNLVGAGPWILTSFALSWVTAGAAAVSLGRHHTRRVL